MAFYTYRALNKLGQSVRGTIEAGSIPDAQRILREQGLREVLVGQEVSAADADAGPIPEDAATVGAKPPAAPPRPKPAPQPAQSLNWAQLAELNGQLLDLVRAGLPLAPSIAAMARYLSGRQGRAVAQRLQTDMEAGRSLAEALERQPAAFPPLCRAMVRAGEASGSLERVLSCLTDYSRAMAEARNRVVETITYPLVLVAAAFLLAMFMLIKVVPVFNDVLMDGMLEYSRPSHMIFGAWVSMADFAAAHVTGIFLIAALVFAAVIWLCVPRPGGRFRFPWADALRLRMPLFGSINRMGAMSQFCRALGMLVEARSPLPDALALAGAASGNLAVEGAAMRAANSVRGGSELGEALIRAGSFDASLCWLVQNGEHQNTLAETLHTLAGSFEGSADRQRRWVLIALGPATTIVIGVIVGFMFFSVYGPLITGMIGLGG